MQPVTVTVLIVLTLVSSLVAQTKEAPDAGAVYDYRRWHYQISDGGYRETISEKVTILNERGQKFALNSFPESDHLKLKSVSVRVLDATGELIYERRKGDLTKACGYDYVAFYNDYCWYGGTFQSQTFPYSVEYESATESESLFFLDGCDFQTMAPVREVVFSLAMKDPVAFKFKTYGLAEGIEPVVAPDGRLYTWSVDDLPALEEIEHVPPDSREPARLTITPSSFEFEKYHFDASSWEALGRSKLQLYQDRFLILPGDSSLRVGESYETAARACYETVQKDIRYVAIQIGLGGWQPHTAELTQKRGFGDCKDMSTLLISRLRNIGVEAHPVFVLIRDQGRIDPEFPAFRFNHVITMALVDGDTTWLDPTCDVCPYGELPLNDQDIDVLVSDSGGGKVIHTPSGDHQANSWRANDRLHLGVDQTIMLSADMTATGLHAQYLRGVLPGMDRDETRRFIDDLLPSGSKRFTVDSYEISDLRNLSQPVTISLKARMNKAARQIGKVIYCTPFVLSRMSGYEMVELTDRELPVNVYFPETVVNRVTLTWDSGLVVDSIVLPATDTLAFPFGDVCVGAFHEGGQITTELTRHYLAFQITPDQFADFTAYRKRLRDILDRQVKLFTH
jgi:hypothetical protein